MNNRLMVSMNASIAVIAIAALVPISAPGQQVKAPAKNTSTWTAPRTADGQPDLRGYWSNSTVTPLERPAALAAKEFFTEQEAAAYEKQRLQQENSQASDDIHYDNALWQTEKWAKGVSNWRTSLVFDPPDGKLPPLTAKAQQRLPALAEAARRRAASDSAQSRSLAERCISWGAKGPPMLGSTYNANLQIVQNSDAVVIYTEIDGPRVIRMNSPHPPAYIHQLGGDSRGHWEGETLVVDSTNFTDQTNFRGPPSSARQDIFSSQDLHVIERFTRTNPGMIVYRFTVEDPSTWTKPWSGEVLMRQTPGPMYEYACHEGNYGLENILAGARADEAKAAKKGGR